MTGRLLDEARAFEIIAPHLTDDTRRKIAARLASRMLPVSVRPAAPVLDGFDADRPEYEAAAADPVVAFLSDLGFAEAELTRAAARLWARVKSDGAAAPITQGYLALAWDRVTGEAKPDA